jgi:hypothetical protein
MFFDVFDGLKESRSGEKSTVGDSHVDTREILKNNMTGAEIKVAGFGVAHFAGRKANSFARSDELAVGERGDQLVEVRCRGESNGIARARRGNSPAVKDEKSD